ncbi:MAG: hypothetical protein ACRDPH_00425 [Marmoricola sp.]
MADENRLLRQRVADLEAAVLRLQVENDTLDSIGHDSDKDVLAPA